MTGGRQGRVAAGLTLIIVGLILFFFLRQQALEPGVILLVIGAVLLAAYFFGRRRGFLVPGAIMAGLGSGLVFEDSLLRFADAAELGLGLGFVAIFVIAFLVEGRRHWWPLVPGVFLVLAGLPWTEDWIDYLFDNWPLILVLVGVLLLLGGVLGGGRGRAAS